MSTSAKQAGHGILAGGNWIIDQVKLIDVYPKPEQLGNIQGQSQGTGGAPFNVLVDLARSETLLAFEFGAEDGTLSPKALEALQKRAIQSLERRGWTVRTGESKPS